MPSTWNRAARLHAPLLPLRPYSCNYKRWQDNRGSNKVRLGPMFWIVLATSRLGCTDTSARWVSSVFNCVTCETIKQAYKVRSPSRSEPTNVTEKKNNGQLDGVQEQTCWSSGLVTCVPKVNFKYIRLRVLKKKKRCLDLSHVHTKQETITVFNINLIVFITSQILFLGDTLRSSFSQMFLSLLPCWRLTVLCLLRCLFVFL